MRQRPRVQRQTQEPADLFATVQKYARTVIQVCIVAFIVALGYILYGVFSGALAQPMVEARILANIRMMGQLMALSATVGTICFILLTIDELAFAVTAALIGLALMFGMPMLVANNLSTGQGAQAASIITEWSRNAGLGMVVIVALRILWEIFIQVRYAGVKRKERMEREAAAATIKQAQKPKSAHVLSPCWNLPYCHEAVREHCPAFKGRKTCWRFGYGCNCDPNLIEALIRSGGANMGKGSEHASQRDRATHEAYIRSDLQADKVVGRERTIPCSKCPIYLEHQRLKFKFINPIAIVLTFVGLALGYKPLMGLYTLVVTAIAEAARRLTYGNEMVDAGAWFDYLNTITVQVFFFIIVGLLLLSYVLKFVEWVVFTKKW